MTVEAQRGTERKITEAMVAELQAELGKQYPAKDQFNTEATRDAIRHWAEGVGDLNPLWLDAEYAARSHYRGIIASPSFLFSCHGRAGKMGMPGIHAFFSGARWVYHRPVRLGDAVVAKGGLHDVVEKKSSFAHRSFILTYRNEFRNQRDEVVAELFHSVIRAERDTAVSVGKYKGVEPHVYTEDELAQVFAGIEAEEIRGAHPRYWEDVAVGEELRPVVKGPLTMSDIVGFKVGYGSHYVHHIRANEARYWMMKRHPGIPIRTRLNVPDCPEGVHMIADTAQAIGMPGYYDYGVQRVAWLQHLVSNWIGDDGWLREFSAEVRRPSIEGDTQWCKGRVAGKRVDGTEHLVELEIWAENQRGEVTAPGSALVLLPVRGNETASL